MNQILSDRLQKMRIKLLDYDIGLKYLKGKYMHIADLLSKNYIPEMTSVEEYDTIGTVHCVNKYNNNNTICDLKKLTKEDEILNKVVRYCNFEWLSTIKRVPNEARLYYNQKN